MKKRTYIQPKIEETELLTSYLMAPGGGMSPTDGSYDPLHMPTWRPQNPTRTPVF